MSCVKSASRLTRKVLLSTFCGLTFDRQLQYPVTSYMSAVLIGYPKSKNRFEPIFKREIFIKIELNAKRMYVCVCARVWCVCVCVYMYVTK